ncbi:hypothetical protein [Spiroplasma ixodetis]|uniref:hypothetical protein n=1 Tax=Spiroplasma ixodetis TaxID=2141 RepID=UPI0025750D6F|nr:hypothetical protein [Spiroplasma ixodetis]WJG69662.1 hypothetical protein SIXOD_v1c05760 [Spiroplasma ixodetis Y32]
MNKQKPFSYKDQEIINEYNKKRNQEITKEHLNNIEKLRGDFKKEIINEYKEKLITYLENKIENDGYRSTNNDSIYYSLIQKINNGEFD